MTRQLFSLPAHFPYAIPAPKYSRDAKYKCNGSARCNTKINNRKHHNGEKNIISQKHQPLSTNNDTRQHSPGASQGNTKNQYPLGNRHFNEKTQGNISKLLFAGIKKPHKEMIAPPLSDYARHSGTFAPQKTQTAVWKTQRENSTWQHLSDRNPNPGNLPKNTILVKTDRKKKKHSRNKHLA